MHLAPVLLPTGMHC